MAPYYFLYTTKSNVSLLWESSNIPHFQRKVINLPSTLSSSQNRFLQGRCLLKINSDPAIAYISASYFVHGSREPRPHQRVRTTTACFQLDLKCTQPPTAWPGDTFQSSPSSVFWCLRDFWKSNWICLRCCSCLLSHSALNYHVTLREEGVGKLGSTGPLCTSNSRSSGPGLLVWRPLWLCLSHRRCSGVSHYWKFSDPPVLQVLTRCVSGVSTGVCMYEGHSPSLPGLTSTPAFRCIREWAALCVITEVLERENLFEYEESFLNKFSFVNNVLIFSFSQKISL